MLIGNVFYMVLAIALPIVIAIGAGILLYRKIGKYGVMISILLGGITWAASIMTAVHVYVVEDCGEVLDYRMLGSSTYELRDLQEITIPYEPHKVIVLNNSTNMVVLEEIVYGGYIAGISPDPMLTSIDPGTHEVFELPKVKIDFFFDESIPEEIEVYGSDSRSRFWLYCE